MIDNIRKTVYNQPCFTGIFLATAISKMIVSSKLPSMYGSIPHLANNFRLMCFLFVAVHMDNCLYPRPTRYSI